VSASACLATDLAEVQMEVGPTNADLSVGVGVATPATQTHTIT